MDNLRILVIDDDIVVYDRYRALLAVCRDELCADAEASELSLDCATLEEGIALVADAAENGQPYQIAIMAVGAQPEAQAVAGRLRLSDHDITIILTTDQCHLRAFEIAKLAPPLDRLLCLCGPFDPDEVIATVRSINGRWRTDQTNARVRHQLMQQVERLEKQSIELAASEARATHIATHDVLTGSANRYAFLKGLNDHLQSDAGRVHVALIDLDRFKNINDTLGHFAGDELIRQMCNSMTAVIGEQGLVARLGGDEFAIAFAGLTSEEAIRLCDQVVAACSNDFTIFGHMVQISASIGLAACQGARVQEPIDLLRRADIALYDAKRKGGSRTRLFDTSMDESIRFRQTIETGLHQAIAQDELHLLFQPIVDRDNRHTLGFEALLRWTSPLHGPVSPTVFIPVAEESTLIHEIGDWAVNEALRACRLWPDHYVSINFSPRQFHRDDFAERLAERAAWHGIPPSRVQVEITETAIFDDNGSAAESLDQLRNLGFRIALDDFGTGYSSLFNIHKFALDCIKIDKSFVDNMGREQQSAEIINSVAHLARSLGLDIVAEGVETDSQYQALRLAGCTHMQGYLFSQPMHLSATTAYLKQYQQDQQKAG